MTQSIWKDTGPISLSGSELTLDSFRSGLFARACSAVTVSIFASVFYFMPAAQAVAQEVTKDDRARELRQQQIDEINERTPESALAYRLQKIKDRVVSELPNELAEREANLSWVDDAFNWAGYGDLPLTQSDLAELQTLKSDIASAYLDAMVQFSSADGLLNGDNLPESARVLIAERQQQAQDQVEQHYAELIAALTAVMSATEREQQYQALDQLEQFLGGQQFKRQHTPDDPNDLPWGTPSKEVREPIVDEADLQASLGINPLAGLPQVASSGGVTAAVLQSALLSAGHLPKPEHLSENIEVKFTDDIKTLAASLNNNPTEIYAWVHNNIRYIPSYGSIQGTQHTLEAKRGNATDTASLLISLLRAANIPARYAYGTVELPLDKVQNWVGNVSNAGAALNLMGQGGIPSIGMARNGVITHVKFEHTWVEAYVDFEPSRGVKNREGDNWIPMDASFKQYEYVEGMDLQQNVPFDAQSLVSSIEQSATVNEQEGWVQGVPQAEIETQLTAFQSQIEDYINSHTPDATVGEVLGLQNIKVLPPRPLAAGLPYNHIATSQRFAEVPSNLRHKFKYSIATQVQGYPNSPFISVEQYTAELAGKKIAVSFKPATTNDEAIIESYLPQPDPVTGAIDPAALPNTLPGYLINLTGELTLGDTVVSSGTAGTMGGELYEALGIYSPAHGWKNSVNHPVAGEYRAIGLDLQGISPEQAARLQANVETTKTKLESGDAAQLATLTKHDVVGDLIYGTIFSYFALNDVQDQIQAQSSGVVTYRLPSYGLFSTSLSTQYWFGLPRNVEFSGLNMDVDLLHYQTVDKANNNSQVVSFHQAAGSRASAMEHLVPEQMFSTPENPAHGISAVKALAIASAEGQKIWTITRDNLDLALTSINLGVDTENEIRNAVNAGKIATAHELQVNFRGWVGSGYLLIDPDTGAGAYKIAGGGNGGFLLFIGLVSLFAIGAVIFASGGVGLIGAGPAILAALGFALGNIFRGLSLILEATGNNAAAAVLCNLSAYTYSAGAFALIGLLGIFGRLLSNMWTNFAAGGFATALLTPLCT